MTRGQERIVLPLCVLAVLTATWWLLSRGGSGVGDFPTPPEVAVGFKEQLRTMPGDTAPMLIKHVVASVFRTTAGFALAAVLAIPLGLVMGWYLRVFVALNPLVQLMRPISPIAWLPISILLAPGDESRSVFIVFIATFFPIAVATTAAVRSIPQVYIRAAHNFGLGGWMLFKKVVLPAALPQILTGLRLTAGIAWMVIVAAEMIAVEAGLGWLIIDARNQGLRYDLIVLTMIQIGLIGVLIDLALRRLENLDQVKWGYSQRG